MISKRCLDTALIGPLKWNLDIVKVENSALSKLKIDQTNLNRFDNFDPLVILARRPLIIGWFT